MKFALAGNPNCGKTTLFNTLTGSTAHVGNWPGVTVDKREGTYKKLEEKVQIVDLPGIYSLSPYTPEEVVSRNFILDEKPDCVINVVDSTNLERNLYLTTQILEIDVPVIIALNMIDSVESKGDKIKSEDIEKTFGVPVVEISALKNKGIDEMMIKAYETAKKPRKGFTVLDDSFMCGAVKAVAKKLEELSVESPVFHAVKFIEGDELETSNHAEALSVAESEKAKIDSGDFDGDFEAIVADRRYDFISRHFSETVIRSDREEKSGSLTKSDKIDKVLTHRIWSIPIFLLIMFIVFHLVFGEDLLFLNSISGGRAAARGEVAINVFSGMGYEDIVGDSVSEFIDDEANGEISWVAAINSAVSDEDRDAAIEEVVNDILENGLSDKYEGLDVSMAIPSPGVFLQSWMGFATGWVKDTLFGEIIFGAAHDGTWYKGLIVDGILNGLDAVCSFIPQILLLFLFMAIMEDCGYMARVAFIMDRAFRKFGLSGKAFIPLLMGFGCSVPAMMASKTLENEKERDMTIRLAPFFSCGAKAPIWATLSAVAVLGAFGGGVFVFCIYLLGIVMAVVSAIFMKLFSKDYSVPPFIMELPAYHAPQARNLAAHLWEKLKHYVYKAATIITASLIVIWFLQNFSWAFWKGVVADTDQSMLADIGRVLKYFFLPCGWSVGDDGWRYAVSALTGLVAKENVVATMAAFGLNSETIGLTGAGIFAYAVYNLFTFPCMAAVATAHGESSKKGFWKTLAFWFFGSYAFSAVVFWIGTLIEYNIALGLIVLLLVIAAIVLAGIVVQRKRKKAVLNN